MDSLGITRAAARRLGCIQWRTPRLAAAPLIGALALVAGCSGDPAPTREVHRAGGGPLTAQASGFSEWLHAPRQAPWTATFAGLAPCSRTGRPITIQAVRYTFQLKPLWWRQRMFVGQGSQESDLTFWSRMGEPEALVGLGRGQSWGRLKGRPAGFKVTNACDALNGPLPQVLTVMRVGKPGAVISRAYIDYTHEGHPYTLEVPYRMIACGTQTPRLNCRDGR